MSTDLVVIASGVQVLLAATFVAAAAVALRDGHSAQHAAEAEVVRQGHPIDLLSRHRIRFEETVTEALFPFGIAVVLAALAALNLAGVEAGRIATWILQPVMLVGGGFVTATQVFADRYVEFTLQRSDLAAGVDARAITAAARSRFPTWLRTLLVTRFLLATAGSVLVLAVVTFAAGDHYQQ